MTTTQQIEKLEDDLREAYAALEASHQAMHTHGHQGITWQAYKADCARIRNLRAKLNAALPRTHRNTE